MGIIRCADVKRAVVRFGENSESLNAHFPKGVRNTESDFATIRDQHFLDHFSIHGGF